MAKSAKSRKDRPLPEREALAAAAIRYRQCGLYPQTTPERQADGRVRLISDDPNEETELCILLADALGTGSEAFVWEQVTLLISVLGPRATQAQAVNAAIALVKGCKPQNEAEAMLAVQAAAAHLAAMSAMARAHNAEWVEPMEAYGRLATQFMRASGKHMETLAKLRRGGSQSVTVKHVHVHDGGQAIVGSVTTPHTREGGGYGETDKQPHAPAGSAHAQLTEMRGEDPVGGALPRASDQGKSALSHARRGEPGRP